MSAAFFMSSDVRKRPIPNPFQIKTHLTLTPYTGIEILHPSGTKNISKTLHCNRTEFEETSL